MRCTRLLYDINFSVFNSCLKLSAWFFLLISDSQKRNEYVLAIVSLSVYTVLLFLQNSQSI